MNEREGTKQNPEIREATFRDEIKGALAPLYRGNSAELDSTAEAIAALFAVKLARIRATCDALGTTSGPTLAAAIRKVLAE